MIYKYSLVLILLICVFSFQDGKAQGDYNAVIDRALGASGDVTDVSSREAYAVGDAFLNRAMLFTDLVNFQAQLGSEYYEKRQDQTDIGTTPLTPYYLARHQLAAGDLNKAIRGFDAVLAASGSPASIKERAKIWKGYVLWNQGKTAEAEQLWASVNTRLDAETATDWGLSQWMTSGKTSQIECPASQNAPIQARCQLLQALFAQQWQEVARLQRSLLAEEEFEDASATLKGDVVIPFYDTASLRIMALADFAQAIEAFGKVQGRQQGEASYWSVRAAYAMGDFTRAESLANNSRYPLKDLYLGLLLFQEGNENGGDATIQKVLNDQQTASIFWAELAGGIRLYNGKVVTYLRNQARESDPLSDRAATLMARGAVLIGEAQTAISIVDRAYRSSDGASIDENPPSLLVLLAHAQYMSEEPRYFNRVLDVLVNVTTTYSVASMAQELARRNYVELIEGRGSGRVGN